MTAGSHAPRLADSIASWLENAGWIDALAAPVHSLSGRLTRSHPGLRDALSGTGLGHAAHPGLVAAPLGCWLGAIVSDVGGDRAAAQRLTGTGVALAVPAVATGLSDWTDTSGAERRVGFVHLVANLTAVTLELASWRARRRGAHARGVVYGAAGMLAAGTGGWIGGHLAYALGVGVDTTAFDGGPTEWTLVTRDPDNPRAGSAAGVPLLIVEDEHGVHVLADRCTHRGGALSEGTIEGDCVTCPWHGSRFSLRSGRVEDGPAVTPQPVYETRVDAEGLHVRRHEPRSLRLNPKRAA